MGKGRPTKYNKEIGDKICEFLSTSDRGLRDIAKELNIATSSILKWLNDNKDFSLQYTRARECQADYLADQIIELSDKARMDRSESISDKGVIETISDNYNRTRLQIDARKWKASKLYPKKYSDKVDHTTNGESINITPPATTVYINGAPPLARNESDVENDK